MGLKKFETRTSSSTILKFKPEFEICRMFSIITFIGAVILAIAGLNAAIGKGKSKRIAEWTVAGMGIVVAISSFFASREQGKYEAEMKEKSEKTISQVQETLETLTGGNSFPYINFLIDQHANIAFPVLSHSGSYPLYDVAIHIIDNEPWSKGGVGFGPTFQDPTKDSFSFSANSLVPNSTFFPKNIYIPLSTSKDTMQFNVQIGARNGWFSQTIYLKKINNKWLRSDQVFKMQRPSETLALPTPNLPAMIAPNVTSLDDIPVSTQLLRKWKDLEFPN